MRALLVGLALPLVEIAGLILVGGWIGVLPVLALVLLGGVVGVILMRSAGLAAPRELQAAMARGEGPAPAIVRASLRVIAGGLLIVPGFVSDLMALVLLIPGVERLVIDRIGLRVMAGRTGRPAGNVIEGDYVDLGAERGPSRWSDRAPGIERDHER